MAALARSPNSARASKPALHCLQAMRAIAAWLVVMDHAMLEITGNDPKNPLTHSAWGLGGAGVYMFFAISGFVMVHISWDHFGEARAATAFLLRRIVRIVPLYWLATFAALGYHRVSATHGADAGLPELLYSLCFIPYPGDAGSWTPIVPGGWSLNYEVMFYGGFAVALTCSRRVALPGMALGLAAFGLARPLISLPSAAYLASPIVLWFVLGMGLGTIWNAKRLQEPAWLARPARFLEPFGNASYSTYLSQGFTLTVLHRSLAPLPGITAFWIISTSFVVTTAVGWAVHSIIEKPMLRTAYRALGQVRGVSAGST